MNAAPTVDTPAWQTSAEAWKRARGVHTPWIAEVSPMQLGMMSPRQRAAYEKRRSAEWSASATEYAAWRVEVVAAFDAGAFTLATEGAHYDAREVVRVEFARRRERAAKEAADAVRAAAMADHWTRETATPGALAWVQVYGWMRVRRCNEKTATLEPLDPTPGSRFAPKFPWQQVLRANPHNPTETPPR